jgi:hypothetical protein
MLLEYRIDAMGEDLLKPAELHEILPDTPLYLRNPIKPQVFTPHTFHHTVNYSTIKEFHQKGFIWKRILSPSTL